MNNENVHREIERCERELRELRRREGSLDVLRDSIHGERERIKRKIDELRKQLKFGVFFADSEGKRITALPPNNKLRFATREEGYFWIARNIQDAGPGYLTRYFIDEVDA